jgi:Flp pilus assembly protein CpaB
MFKESKINYKLWLVLSVVFALGVAYLSFVLVQNYAGAVKVVIASKDINQNDSVSPSSINFVSYPKSALYKDTVINPAEIAGMIAKGYIPQGTVLRKSMFIPPQMAGMSGQIKLLGDNYYAVAVPSSLNTTIAGTLQPGDYVDIYKNDKANANLVLKNVKVMQTPVTQKDGSGNNAQGIVLAIQEQDLNTLLSSMNGNLTFVLHPTQNQDRKGD